MRLLLLPFLMWGIAPAAHAGAWLRDRGAVFVAPSLSFNLDKTRSGSVYLEYGLFDTWTLGGKVDAKQSPAGEVDVTGQIFVRRPLPLKFGAGVWSYTVGAGVEYDGVTRLPIVTSGVSYGRGIKVLRWDGWLAVDGAMDWNVLTNEQTYKLDATVGVILAKRHKVIVQGFGTKAPGFRKLAVGVSYVYDVFSNPDAGRTTSVFVGFEADTLTPENPLVKLGVWQAF